MDLDRGRLNPPLEHTDEVLRHGTLSTVQGMNVPLPTEAGVSLPLLVVERRSRGSLRRYCIRNDRLRYSSVPEDAGDHLLPRRYWGDAISHAPSWYSSG